jgi:hypothetical protein
MNEVDDSINEELSFINGRPKKWNTASELQDAINTYFQECDERIIQVYDKTTQSVKNINKPIPYTIEGLCEILDCGRSSLLRYEKEKGYEEFWHTIKKAKLKIQRNKLERGLSGESNPAVTIFDLKNNHLYKDKTEQDLNIKQTEPITIIYNDKKLDLNK